ncbi:MAG TPA: phosphoribosylformylglycinamidine synthase subunit PurQ [Hyphomicrobiales bacterium]|nr:phosphoribosylformylglycinamidine synthase subunit PurQ [Hyphomicrobiales bacterium]
MKAGVVVFPGSNCDRDAAVTLQAVTGHPAQMIWHGDSDMPDCDLIVVPGGFSYGDYLRSGAMAAHSPICRAIVEKAKRGVPVLGICNGFQVLTETGLLPGALMRNASLRYICKDVTIRPERTDTIFTSGYEPGKAIRVPIAHKDGNYYADSATLDRLEGEGRVAFRYCDEDGHVTETANPNGSQRNIAGLYSESGRILGMMPHPERLADEMLGGDDGRALFQSLLKSLH